MDWKHVLGNTYVLEGTTALLPVYRLRGGEVILLDTGLARGDREGLSALLEKEKLTVRGVICTHAHYDHTGNARFLQEKYHCPVAMPASEAFIAASPEAMRANYQGLSFGQCRALFQEEWVRSDELIPADAKQFSFCGVTFGIFPLYGHTIGQIGVVTPDNVAYLADTLIDPETLASFKLPTIADVEKNKETVNTLQSFQHKAYILSHKAVVTALAPVIEANLRYMEETKQVLLACLSGQMTISEWMAAFCDARDVHTRNPFIASVLRRNFHDYTDYLVDCGCVVRQTVNGVTHHSVAT